MVLVVGNSSDSVDLWSATELLLDALVWITVAAVMITYFVLAYYLCKFRYLLISSQTSSGGSVLESEYSTDLLVETN